MTSPVLQCPPRFERCFSFRLFSSAKIGPVEKHLALDLADYSENIYASSCVTAMFLAISLPRGRYASIGIAWILSVTVIMSVNMVVVICSISFF